MSDRDGIDVKNAEEETTSTEKKSESKKNKDDNEIYSTKSKINHAIRQNPLTHLGEKSDKPTFLEKLKRAFSTEDTYSGGFIADEEPEEGGLIDDTYDVFDEIAKKIKQNKANKKEAKAQDSAENVIDILSQTAEDKVDVAENIQAEVAKAEDEQKTDIKTTDKNNADVEKNATDAKNESESENHSEKAYDEEDALEGGEFSFLFKEAIVDSEEKIEAKAEDEPKSTEKIEDKAEEEPKSTEKTEDKAEDEPKSTEKTEDKTEEEPKSTEKTEDKAEDEPKSDEKTEDKAEEEPKSDEKAEDKTEEKPKSDKMLNINSDELKKHAVELKNKTAKALGEVSGKASDKFKETSGKLKVVCSKTKDKLIEMWNTKIDEEVPASNPEQKPVTDEKIEKVTEEPSKEIALEESTEKSEDKVVATIITPDTDDVEKKQEENPTENIAPKTQDNTEVDTESLYADLFGTESESEKFKRELYGDEEIRTSKVEIELVAFDKADEKTENIEADKIPLPMTVIKNDNAVTSEFDSEKLRETLNVIDGEKAVKLVEDIEQESIEDQPLTEEDQRQLEVNQKVLDKVRKFEEETSSQREEIKRASAERTAKAYEKEFGAVEPIKELEVVDYIIPNGVEEIKVKAGKFSDSVRSEYEFYVGYNRLKNVAKNQSRIDYVSKTVTESTKATRDEERRYSEFSNDEFAKSRDRLDSVTKRLDYRASKNSDTVEYRSEEDAPEIKKHIKEKYKKSRLMFTISLLITVVTFVLFCFSGKFAADPNSMNSGSERIFAIMNLLLYAGSIYVCKDTILNGLQPLKNIKSNGDTGVAAATVAVAFQSLLAVIVPNSFFRQGLNVYTIIVMLALTMNSLGKYLNDKRVNANFRFVSDSSLKYTGKFFHDQRMVATLLSGTRNEKTELVFQKKTAFLRHFLTLSYSDDPGEAMANRFALPTMIFAVIISIVYGFLSKNFVDTISVLSIMLCMAVPVCSKVLVAIPLHKLAKESLANQAMVVGYPAVENFAESAAMMIDAKELYPEGSVHLNGIRTFDPRRVDDALLAAAAVMISAGGAMAGMFDEIIQGDKQEVLPNAEGVMYEDGKGIIGWVNNERIFVGNRDLLIAHGVEPMSVDYEEEQRKGGDEILYLACAGELVAMLLVGYSANRRVADALRRMEASGMTLLIRTTDVNITADRISKDFGIYHRTIKVLKQNNSNVIRDEMIGKEKSSPAFVATKGGITSFGRAVSGCIQTKRNISLSLVIQTVAVLLGLLFVTTIVLFAGVHQLGAMEMFLFSLFWCITVLVAVPISQKIQKLN